MLAGCGLRRDEAVRLTFEHIQRRDGRWCVVDLVGKKGRYRTVPIPAWAKTAIDAGRPRPASRPGPCSAS
jgi:integrase